MSGFLTRGFKLSYKSGSGSTYTTLTNLQEWPDLGGDIDTVEVTTLDDSAHTFINGLANYGSNITFKFLYDPTQFATLNALSGQIDWKCELPDGASGALDTAITFTGESHCKLDGKGTNDAITYSLIITPSTAMVFA